MKTYYCALEDFSVNRDSSWNTVKTIAEIATLKLVKFLFWMCLLMNDFIGILSAVSSLPNILSDGSKQEFLLQCRKLTYSSIVNRPESSCILILIQGLSSYGRWRRCHEFPLFDIDVLIKKKTKQNVCGLLRKWIKTYRGTHLIQHVTREGLLFLV